MNEVKKRVLMVCYDNLGIGGIQNVIMSIVRHMNESCSFDAIVFNHDNLEYEEEFKKQGKIFTINWYKGKNVFLKRLNFYIRPFKNYYRIRKIIKENGPYDVIHCHNHKESALALAAARKENIKLRISHSHGYSPYKLKGHYIRKIYNYIYKKMIRINGNLFLACSEIAAIDLFGTRCKARIIPNFIDLNIYKKEKNIECNPFSIISIGRYCEQKNQLFLIEVFKHVLKKHSDAHLTIIGYNNNSYYRCVCKKILEMNLQNNITLKPGSSNVFEELKKNNVFLLPSTFEGLGIVFIEAQAVGLKCFASTRVPKEANCGGITYIS